MKGLRKPNSSVWHVAPTYKQAKLISWEKFKRIIPQEAMGKKPNDTDLIITLKNGSRLFLMGSDDPDSLRGPEPDHITLEEAAYHKADVWEKVLRPSLLPRRGSALFISTPAGYNWFKDLEDRALQEIKNGSKDWFVSHSTCYENPHISHEEIELARKECSDERAWRQEYMAEYESSVGRVFSGFSGGLPHVQPVALPVGNFTAYRGIDWGMRDDTGCLWGFVRSGILHIYREYGDNNMGAPQQAEIIRNLTPTRESIAKNAISHDAAKEDPAKKGLTVLWHFRQAGINPTQTSSRDKKSSRMMIQQLIHENRLIIDGQKCPKLRKQMLSYEWKDTTMERPDDLGNDDMVDALHYLVEMLQFDLFMGASKSKENTMPEIMAAIAAEKLSQQKGHYKVPSIFNKNEQFGDQFENSTAGYL